eukprot:gene17464-23766_t
MVGDLQDEMYGARLWDISLLARSDLRVDFSSYHPYYKKASVYNGKILSLPVDGSTLLLYYNKDSLKQANIREPSTLEELVTAARLLNGTNNSYGERQYGFCFNDGGSDCSLTGYDLLAVFSQMFRDKDVLFRVTRCGEGNQQLQMWAGKSTAKDLDREISSLSRVDKNKCNASLKFTAALS